MFSIFIILQTTNEMKHAELNFQPKENLRKKKNQFFVTFHKIKL